MHYAKDFNEWSRQKYQIQAKQESQVYFYEREIWFLACGVNIGFEQDGKGERFARPVVILKKFNKQVFWGVPLTKIQKKGKYYFEFRYTDKNFSNAILSQLRLFDVHRLIKKDGTMKETDFTALKTKIRELLAP